MSIIIISDPQDPRPPPRWSRQQRLRPLIIAATLLVVPPVVVAQQPDPGCFALTASTYCTDFAAASIFGGAGAAAGATDAPPFTDVASFDNFMANVFGAQGITDFQTKYGCPGYTGTELRYYETSYCGLLVGAATVTNHCNTAMPPQICRSIGDAFLASLKSLFSDTNLCPGTNQNRIDDLNSITGYVQSLSVDYDPARPAACIRASKDAVAFAQSETANCGFQNADKAKAFCSSTPPPPSTSPENVRCCSSLGINLAPASASTSTATAQSTSPATASQPLTSSSPSRPATTSSSPMSPSPSVSSAASNSSSSSTDSNSVLGLSMPVFIGAVVGGSAVLIALVVGIILACGKKRPAKRVPSPAKPNNNSSNNSSTHNEDYVVNSPMNKSNNNARGYQQQHDARYDSELGLGVAGMGLGLPDSGMVEPRQDMAEEGETMVAVFNYVPNLSDEIYLYVGDPVIVKCRFDDGWSYVYNMTTKQEGSVPQACVAPYDVNRESLIEPSYLPDESLYDPSRASFTIRQRQSSMFGPPAGFRETMMTDI